jgi:multidrug efflux pump subunit AcrB
MRRPAAAAIAGLDPDAVAKQVEAQVGGTVATRLLDGEALIDVRVRVPLDLRRRADALSALQLRAPDGRTVALRQVAQISIAGGQRQISREDLAPFIPVTARLEGLDLGSGIKAVQAKVAELKLPPSIRIDYGGLYAQQKQSFADLTMVFVAALLLSALLLTFLFETWAFTVSVIATVLLSAMAVFFGLWITGTELDISALMGLTMVVGMITELAIFYLAELKYDAPIDAAALLKAGRARLRPILMSALIAILTLMPLALGIGRGSGLQKPLAVAIISGLTIGAPLVLMLLPGLVLLLNNAGRRWRSARP